MALKKKANMNIAPTTLFVNIPSHLNNLMDILSSYDPENEDIFREQYERYIRKLGASISVISHELENNNRTFFRLGRSFDNTRFRNFERMVDDVNSILAIMAYLSEMDSKLDRSGKFKVRQTGEIKKLNEVTVKDLIDAIPPIIDAFDRRAKRDFGKDLKQIRKEYDERMTRRMFEMDREKLLKSPHTCPHCGASKKYKEKDIIEGTNAKVICQNKKCKQEFIIQEIEELLTQE